MALDRKIIAVFSIAFLGFIGLMIRSYNDREYIETVDGEVILAYSKIEGIQKFPGLERYEYYLRIRMDRGVITIEVNYELFRVFVVQSGVVVLEKYHRPLSGMYEYEVVSWKVNE